MAFEDGTLIPLSASANSNAGKVWLYKEDATLAAIRAANYFNNAYPEYGIADEDVMMLIGSDGFGFSNINIDVSGNVTVVESLTSA